MHYSAYTLTILNGTTVLYEIDKVTKMIEHSTTKHEKAHIYPYADNFGVVACRKVRQSAPKGFFWEHLNEDGVWIAGLGARIQYRYRLPEGEKDADTSESPITALEWKDRPPATWLPIRDLAL